MDRGGDAGAAVLPELRPAGHALVGADLEKRVDFPPTVDMKLFNLGYLHSVPRFCPLRGPTLAHNAPRHGRGGWCGGSEARIILGRFVRDPDFCTKRTLDT